MTSFIVIPARLASTRLPGKLLLTETGKPLIQHTYEAAARAQSPQGLCVAADHPRIAAAVQQFGGSVLMTDPNAPSGTDRVAEVAAKLPDIDIIINVQGDEPEIEPAAIDTVVAALENNPVAVMSTLATPIYDRQLLEDPACVKMVRNQRGEAMYFSRSAIPHPRQWSDEALRQGLFLQHVGLYAYRREFLLNFAHLPQSAAEKLESLEQLRVLDHGFVISVEVVEHAAVGIDTPADYEAFVSRAA